MPEPQGAVNLYFCTKCKTPLATMVLEEGITPKAVACINCKRDLMQSCGYNVLGFLQQLKICNIQVTHVWYRPPKAVFLTYEPAIKEHLLDGGLMLKEITKGYLTAGLEIVTPATVQAYYASKPRLGGDGASLLD